jgi:hypothetical protein
MMQFTGTYVSARIEFRPLATLLGVRDFVSTFDLQCFTQ